MNTQEIIVGTTVITLLVFIPGYALARGLYARKKLDSLWIIGLSFVLGLTPPLIVYALEKNLGIPATTETSLLTAAFVTCVGAVLWYSRMRQ